jgi:2'-5' RNA ligase
MSNGSEMGQEEFTETWRVFCAIELPENVREQLTEYISALRRTVPQARASGSRLENIHLTLKFLGEIPRTKVESFTLATKRAVEGFDPFTLRVGQAGVFPPHGSPRVLWIGVQDSSGKLAALHARLEGEAAKAGFEKEARSFHPHLTLARLRRLDSRGKKLQRNADQLTRSLAAAHKEMRFPLAKFTVSELLVIRSELSSEGSKYSVISRHALGEPQY